MSVALWLQAYLLTICWVHIIVLVALLLQALLAQVIVSVALWLQARHRTGPGHSIRGPLASSQAQDWPRSECQWPFGSKPGPGLAQVIVSVALWLQAYLLLLKRPSGCAQIAQILI